MCVRVCADRGSYRTLSIDDVFFEVFFVGEKFRDEFFAGRSSVGMYGLGIACDKRVPVRKRFPFMHQPIGAGFGHPFEEFGLLGREHGAFGNEFVAVCIVGATAGVHVQQPAGHAGIVHLAGFLDLELVDAALGAPIAEGFPLGGIQFVKLLSVGLSRRLSEC